MTAVSTGFTDDPLVPGQHTMKVLHISELRQRIDALREQRGVTTTPFPWTPIVAGSTPIRANHITEMRTALSAVYVKVGRPLPVYTDPILSAGASIKAAHVTELRAAVSLARLRADQGLRTKARSLLAPVYGWFSEGFGETDLMEARALLGALGQHTMRAS